MRTITFSMLVAAGISLMGTSGASAAPANGPAIGAAAAAGQMIDQVWYRGYGYRPYYGYGYRPYYGYGYRPHYGYGYRRHYGYGYGYGYGYQPDYGYGYEPYCPY